MLFDYGITFGNLLTIFVLGAGGVGFVYTMRGRIDGLSARMLEIEREMHQLVTILIEQGKQDERLRSLDARVLAQGQRLDELTNRFNASNGRNGHSRRRR